MGSLSTLIKQKLLDEVLGGVAYAPEATVSVRLCTTAPTQAAAGTECTTTNWTNYARVSVTNDTTSWPAASAADPSAKQNGVIISFGTATCSANETIRGFEIWNAANTERIGWHAFAADVIVQDGNPVSFPIGSITISMAAP